MNKPLYKRAIHISGSCSRNTDLDVINFSHDIVRNAIKGLLNNGATFVTLLSSNPKVDENDDKSPSIIFDWDVLDEIYLYAKELSFSKETKNLSKVITTSKSLKRIPSDKATIWDELVTNGIVSIVPMPFGWNSGAVRRQTMEMNSDALLAIGGGEGVEHLAQLFSARGKPIFPLDIPVGSSSDDGKGGAVYLSKVFFSKPKNFIPKISNEMTSKSKMLEHSRWKDKPKKYAEAIVDFISEVSKSQAFLIRLQNDKFDEYSDVKHFFETVIIPYITDIGLNFKDMEISKTEEGFLNVEIFKEINNSSIVVADLTASRPNCFIEMGYAFGLNRKVIVTVRDDTKLPFDSKMIPCFFWNSSKSSDILKEELHQFWSKNIDRGPLVPPTDLV